MYALFATQIAKCLFKKMHFLVGDSLSLFSLGGIK
jgi:hypothetical protein